MSSAPDLLLQQEYSLVDVDQLEVHPDNARVGDLGLIGTSIESNGFYGAVIAQRSSGRVLAGNHRLQAAREQGARVVPVLWVDVDDDHARRIMLVDNRANDVAGYDNSQLAEVLAMVEDFTGTGFTEDLAAEIIAGAAIPPQLNNPDDAPDVPDHSQTITCEGDVWQLGPHRLVCGSATDVATVRSALGDTAAQMVFTDPPYGVDYTGGTGLKIVNDDLDDQGLRQLLDDAFAALAQVLAPGAAFYICSPSGDQETTFRLALRGASLRLRQQIVWVKDRLVLGRSDYHGQHETLLYGWQGGSEPHFDASHTTLLYGWQSGAAHQWEGGRRQTTVWEHARPHRSDVHPTMKPVELVRRAIENNTRPGHLVLDPFAGSGSTLIAASDAGRTAALVELDPRYCDVIVERYREHTGIAPTRTSR